MNIAGGDLLFLGLEGFVYFGLVFFVEHMRTKGSITRFFTKEESIPYA